MKRDELTFDVIIVGAGPAGLAAAIHLGQASASRRNSPLSIGLLEKGGYPGAHVLSGAVMDPRGLDLLFPSGYPAPPWTMAPVTQEHFLFLTGEKNFSLPHFGLMANKNAVLTNLGGLCRRLAQHAEKLGVQLFFGFTACHPLFHPSGALRGVQTGDMGRDSQGRPLANFQPGVRLLAPITLIAEGARGYLATQLIRHYHLDRGKTPQHYALGIKEVWDIPPSTSQPGTIEHTVGWPLNQGCQGGGFIYHTEKGRLDLGLVVNLDYANPKTDPFALMQRWKTHPWLQKTLAGGKPLQAGARVLAKGGIQSLPHPAFPGGLLMGDAAGFFDGVRMKGIHNAILSGIAAAQTILQLGDEKADSTLWSRHYWQKLRASILPDLTAARNVQPGLRSGLWSGMLHGLLDQKVFKGKAPWTWHQNQPDRSRLQKAIRFSSSPTGLGDAVIDRDQALFLAGVRHRENQPSHIQISRTSESFATHVQDFAFPEQHYCPAGVFSLVTEQGAFKTRLRPQRCLHCQTCAIKDPTAAITWTPPEGGSGPHYQNM